MSGKYLTVTSTGDVSSTGAINVDGWLAVNSGSHNITLNSANSFVGLSLSGAVAVVVNNSKMTELLGISLTGSLDLTVSGEVNDGAKTTEIGRAHV